MNYRSQVTCHGCHHRNSGVRCGDNKFCANCLDKLAQPFTFHVDELNAALDATTGTDDERDARAIFMWMVIRRTLTVECPSGVENGTH